jgi:hypothetical protein
MRKHITSHGVTERTRRNRDGTTSRVEALGAMNDRRRDAISRRDMDEEERFNTLLSRVQGRLQYKELIAEAE